MIEEFNEKGLLARFLQELENYRVFFHFLVCGGCLKNNSLINPALIYIFKQNKSNQQLTVQVLVSLIMDELLSDCTTAIKL